MLPKLNYLALSPYFLLLLKFTDSQKVPIEDYRCGTGSMSTSMSYSVSSSCDQVQLNQCCTIHDTCYASCYLPQLSCDNLFCDCVSRINSSSFCQGIVFPAHCNMVRTFGNMFICPMQATVFNKLNVS